MDDSLDMRSETDILSIRTASSAVAARLRAEIQGGELAPGARLRQSEVAQRFGVSTTPVREAFALLQAQGLVRIDPHKGAIVFHPSAREARELYEMRLVLETLAVEKAMPNFTPEIVDELQALLDRMPETGGGQDWMRLHSRFHIRIYSAANRPRLVHLIENLRDASSAYINMFVADHHGADISRRQHQAILEGIRKGDGEATREAISEHLRVTLDALLESLEQDEAG